MWRMIPCCYAQNSGLGLSEPINGGCRQITSVAYEVSTYPGPSQPKHVERPRWDSLWGATFLAAVLVVRFTTGPL
ncbi:hypothetical protein IF1G_05905 [Cordyceps javanica]|uniref:Uncharacterized protein n=1 Tax=Cordyceps javanica TaxID=43265 RepID=A0A545UZN9_9HYPO|nr:hypothetical protein IF1G_05905 [Cordyceps javanica]